MSDEVSRPILAERMHYDALRNWYTTDSGRRITDEDLCRSVVDADPDPKEIEA